VTGAEHYAEAEYLLTQEGAEVAVLGHALLALAAATALGAQTSTPGGVYQEWHNAAGPAKAKAGSSS
jgi:hypothetical protein